MLSIYRFFSVIRIPWDGVNNQVASAFGVAECKAIMTFSFNKVDNPIFLHVSKTRKEVVVHHSDDWGVGDGEEAGVLQSQDHIFKILAFYIES